MTTSDPHPSPPLRAPSGEYDEVYFRAEGGSLAYHRSWRQAYERANETVRQILDKEEATAQRVRDFGFDVELNAEAAARELAGGRDADAFVGGIPAQLKATTGASRRTWVNNLKPGQARLIFLDALEAVDDERATLSRLSKWAQRNPGHTVWLIRSYESPPRIERIEP